MSPRILTTLHPIIITQHGHPHVLFPAPFLKVETGEGRDEKGELTSADDLTAF